MSKELDVDALVRAHDLSKVGSTANSDVYALSDGILVIIPFLGSKDTFETAQENAAQQRAYFRGVGEKGAVIIFFDRMTSQDRRAREVYQDMGDALTATALVGGSLLGRAMASFFLGIAKPPTPLRLFADFDAALEWVGRINASSDRTLPEPN